MTATPLQDDFRHAMRRVASGVALVTTGDGAGRRFGLAMTAFMSLSFDPPSLLLAVNRNASALGPLLEIGRFCVNVLASHQGDLCRSFASAPAAERFNFGDWEEADGLPGLADSQSQLICTLGSHRVEGSHEVIVGLVERVVNHPEIRPLLFVDGRYGSFS